MPERRRLSDIGRMDWRPSPNEWLKECTYKLDPARNNVPLGDDLRTTLQHFNRILREIQEENIEYDQNIFNRAVDLVVFHQNRIGDDIKVARDTLRKFVQYTEILFSMVYYPGLIDALSSWAEGVQPQTPAGKVFGTCFYDEDGTPKSRVIVPNQQMLSLSSKMRTIDDHERIRYGYLRRVSMDKLAREADTEPEIRDRIQQAEYRDLQVFACRILPPLLIDLLRVFDESRCLDESEKGAVEIDFTGVPLKGKGKPGDYGFQRFSDLAISLQALIEKSRRQLSFEYSKLHKIWKTEIRKTLFVGQEKLIQQGHPPSTDPIYYEETGRIMEVSSLIRYVRPGGVPSYARRFPYPSSNHCNFEMNISSERAVLKSAPGLEKAFLKAVLTPPESIIGDPSISSSIESTPPQRPPHPLLTPPKTPQSPGPKAIISPGPTPAELRAPPDVQHVSALLRVNQIPVYERKRDWNEFWWADMPPYFPFGETIYTAYVTSRQIDEDLEEELKKQHIEVLKQNRTFKHTTRFFLPDYPEKLERLQDDFKFIRVPPGDGKLMNLEPGFPKYQMEQLCDVFGGEMCEVPRIGDRDWFKRGGQTVQSTLSSPPRPGEVSSGTVSPRQSPEPKVGEEDRPVVSKTKPAPNLPKKSITKLKKTTAKTAAKPTRAQKNRTSKFKATI